MSQLNSFPWTGNPERTQNAQPGEIVADRKQRPCRLRGWSTHAAFAAESGAADYQPANAER